jgi:hypothetical protein
LLAQYYFIRAMAAVTLDLRLPRELVVSQQNCCSCCSIDVLRQLRLRTEVYYVVSYDPRCAAFTYAVYL